MDRFVLGNGAGYQPVDDPYVIAFSRPSKRASNLFSPFLPVLLVCRIWYVDRKVARLRGHGQSQLRPILHALIDAGAIYTLTLIMALIFFASQNNGQYVVLAMVSPVRYRERVPLKRDHWSTGHAHHLYHVLHGHYPHRVRRSGSPCDTPVHGQQCRRGTKVENTSSRHQMDREGLPC